VITLLSLEAGLMPGNLNSRQLDPACGAQVRLTNATGTVRHAMSNSFGFGGSNCALVFAAGDAAGAS
jgi:3-oxoacyl-[acyl-carrier-protein] synthase-1